MKLKLHTQPEVPLEAECISPVIINGLKVKEIEKLKVFHGNREVNIADFFSISDNKSELLEISGDMHKIKYIGANMQNGEIQIEGAEDSVPFNADFTSYHTRENDKKKCGSKEERLEK